MRKGNAALFLVIVSAVSLAITTYLAQQELTIRRTGAAAGGVPVARINTIPPSARVGETIDIEAQVDDADKNLADPLSIFSNAIKLYYSKTVGPTNPDAWTEIPASHATYQCYTDNNGDHCKIFARWTPPEPGTFTFIVNGMDKAGNKCSGNPYFNYAGQTEWVRCSINNDDWREITIATSPQVAGHVRDQDGKGIPNVSVGIYPQGIKEYVTTTDTNGYYSLQSNDLPTGKLYSVRPQAAAPAGHKSPPKTTNTTKSLNTVTNTNTPANSTAYDNQKIGQGDCGKVEVAGIGCDFVYDKLPATASPTPTKSPTPTPKPAGTYSLSIAPSATVNLNIGQEQDVTVTLRENGQPVQEQNAFTYFWTVQSNNGAIDVESVSPRVKTIKGLKAGQVFIHISVTDDNNTVLTQSIMTVNVTQPSPTPTLTPTPTPSTVPEGSPTPSPVVSVTPSPSPTPVSDCLKNKGDSNCDGRINLTDYAIWRQEYLGGCTSRNGTFKACGEDRDDDHRPIDADFNLDGLVKLVDFAIWRDNVQ